MDTRRSRYLVTCLLGLVAGLTGSAACAELLDVAARLSYGYYNEEPRVVRAAFEALERMPDSPEVQYHRALAAMRLVELGSMDRDLLDRCTDVGESLASSPTLAVESDVLVAACSSLALRAPPLKSMRRHRHREAALERVLAREPGHPRALWVAAWDESLVALHTGRPLPEPQRLALARVVEAFRDWDADGDVPNWGYAEALAHLGAACLAAGDARRGRDLLEEALLVAPGYRLALELMVRLKASAYP